MTAMRNAVIKVTTILAIAGQISFLLLFLSGQVTYEAVYIELHFL